MFCLCVKCVGLVSLVQALMVSVLLLQVQVMLSQPRPPPKTADVLTSSDGRTRLKSFSLLDPECPVKLLDLTEQDYDVNAPVDALLQGTEILTALDIPMET